MNVVVFSGTTEGRSFSRALAALGAAVTVCVATELGAEEQGCADGITVRTGRLDAEGMTALLRGAVLCVDATHPYAAEATRNIRAAAAAAGVEYHRLLRPASPLPAGSVVLADAARAAAYLADRPGRVLLATGAKELPAFAALDPARLYPRVLPTLAGIAACEAAGVPHRNILAMQGPFTKELNAALLHQFHIDYMVTKDGGAAGGFAEKAEGAARGGGQLCSSLCCAARTTRARPLTQFYSDAGSFYEDHIGGHGQRSARQPDSGGAGGTARSGADHRRAPPAGKPARGLHGQPRSPL